MFPRCQHSIQATQADNSGGGLPFLPPYYKPLVGKLWPAAPGVSRLRGTNNELDETYSAAALASLLIGASQAR